MDFSTTISTVDDIGHLSRRISAGDFPSEVYARGDAKKILANYIATDMKDTHNILIAGAAGLGTIALALCTGGISLIGTFALTAITVTSTAPMAAAMWSADASRSGDLIFRQYAKILDKYIVLCDDERGLVLTVK